MGACLPRRRFYGGDAYCGDQGSRRARTAPMNKIVTIPRAEESVEVPAQEKITVLNPVGFPPKISRKTPSPRPESLDGKTIYLVDCRFDDSVELLRQVQGWFTAHMPSVKTKIISLSATYQKDDPKTWTWRSSS